MLIKRADKKSLGVTRREFSRSFPYFQYIYMCVYIWQSKWKNGFGFGEQTSPRFVLHRKRHWHWIWYSQFQLPRLSKREKRYQSISIGYISFSTPSLWLTHHCNRIRRGRKCPSRDILLVLDKDLQSRSSLHPGSAWCLTMHRESSESPLYSVISICYFSVGTPQDR